jgi:hypothetical protein
LIEKEGILRETVETSPFVLGSNPTQQSLFLWEMELPTTVRTGIEHVINGAT